MKLSIALVAFFLYGVTSAPGGMWNADSAHPLQLVAPNAPMLDSSPRKGTLTCSVVWFTPKFGFDFRFHTGYQVTLPARELPRPNKQLTIVLRIRPETRKDDPVYLAQTIQVPAIEANPGIYTTLQGKFLLGEGSYHVDWLMHDGDGRLCASFWNIDTKADRKNSVLAKEIPKDLIQPAGSTPFDEDLQVTRRPAGSPLNIKVIVNFAPQILDATTLMDYDLQGLAMILRKVGLDPRIGRFSIVTCSVRAQQILYRQEDAPDMNLRAVGDALKDLKPGMVDAKQLAKKNGETQFLAELIANEMRDDSYDAVILVGPKYPLNVEIPNKIIDQWKAFDHRVFYLNYDLNPVYFPWRDSFGRVTKRLHGSEYTISQPRDLFTAWSNVVSRILKSKAPVVSMNRQP